MVLGGHKQPQQVFSFQYLAILGYKPDFVINVLGANEIGLPYSENYLQGIHIDLPRSQIRKEAAEAEYFGVGTSSISMRASSMPSRIMAMHPFAQYILRRFQRRFLPYEQTRGKSIEAHRKNSVYIMNNKMSEEEVIKESIGIWNNSAMAGTAIANSLGAEYFEYLQPNQYVVGSKPMSPEERRIAIVDDHPYGKIIQRHYSKKLHYPRLNNTQVWDGRFIFENNDKILYSDNCCHLNSEGMTLISKDIAKRVAFRISNRNKHITK